MEIRGATRADAAVIASIYNQGIEDRSATLETQLRTADERAEWLATRGLRHPVLVAVDSMGTVMGWGSLNAFNPRPAAGCSGDAGAGGRLSQDCAGRLPNQCAGHAPVWALRFLDRRYLSRTGSAGRSVGRCDHYGEDSRIEAPSGS